MRRFLRACVALVLLSEMNAPVAAQDAGIALAIQARGLAAQTQAAFRVATPLQGDNAAYLQSLFSKSGTVTVRLACGMYNVQSALTIPHNGKVVADPRWTYDTPGSFSNSIPCATIKADNTSGNFTTSGTAVVTLQDYAWLEGVAVQGTNTAGQADALKIAGRFTVVRDNYLFNANNGLLCQSSVIGLQLVHNLIGYNKNYGVSIPSGCPDALIQANTVFSNAFIGLAIYASSKQTLTNNTIEWNGTHGIELYNDNSISIVSNELDRNSGAGLRVNGSGGANTAITATGNSFRRNGAGASTGTDVHVKIDGSNSQVIFSGNTYFATKINDDNTGVTAPNYVFAGNSAALTSSLVAESPVAQNLGIYEDDATQAAIQPLVAATAPDARPTIYNYSPAALTKWRIALAKAAAGVGRAKIAALGDSTTVGQGAGTGGTAATGARARSYPAYLRALLAATGATATDENVLGDFNIVGGTTTAAVTSFEPRITFAGSSWTRSGFAALAGFMFTSSSGSDAITFTPGAAVDTCDIWYLRYSSYGTFTITDSSGTLATVNANGSSAFVKATVTRTASTSPISVQRSAAGNLVIAGFDCYNAGAPGITIANLGHAGVSTVTKAQMTSPWDGGYALAAYAPDLTLISLGINDQRGNVTVAAYTTALQTLITQAKLSGDVILVWHHPDSAPVYPALTAPYRAAMLALARSNGVPMIDLSERFGSYTAMSALYYDPVHLLAPGYQDVARAILPLIQP